MSRALRRSIAYWICLIIGTVGLCGLTYSTVWGDMEMSLEVGIACAVFLGMMLNPHSLSKAWLIILNGIISVKKAVVSKISNQKNEQQN